MKTFRIIVEFQAAPDNISMEVAKALAAHAISHIPDNVLITDESEYLYTLSDIHREQMQ